MEQAQLVPLLIGAGFALLGAIFVTIGVLRGRMTRGWTSTTGMVVDRQGRTTGWPAAYPTFRWRDQQGTEHQHTSMVRASLGPRPGSTVPVRYDPDQPSRAVIDSTVQSGRIFTIIGIGLVLVGVVLGAMFLVVLSAFDLS